jgi:hypothetical protein
VRNKHGGTCYRCNGWCDPGEGHFERFRGGWRVQHATCAVEFKGVPDAGREADRIERLRRVATGTGRPAQNARRALREIETNS